MYQNVNARAERLFLLIKPIVLWRSRCRPLRLIGRAGKESFKFNGPYSKIRTN